MLALEDAFLMCVRFFTKVALNGIFNSQLPMQVHSTVRQRWLDGDKFIISTMAEVADIALEGRTAILEKNYAKLADLMNRNFDLRR